MGNWRFQGVLWEFNYPEDSMRPEHPIALITGATSDFREATARLLAADAMVYAEFGFDEVMPWGLNG